MSVHLNDVIKELKSFSFFSSFNDELLHEIAALSGLKSYQKSQIILEQGQTNETIYFLRAGEVGVYVDGERVARLQKVGEVFGEMSVISSKAVSATLKAESPVECYSIDTSRLFNLSEHDRNHFLHILYRVYSAVLAERLVITNEKAKRFESVTRALQQAQHQLQAYDSQFKEKTLEKIKFISDRRLIPLRENLNQAMNTASPYQRTELKQIVKEIDEFIEAAKPLNDLYKSEKAIQSKKVILADPQKKQQMIAKMALGGTGVSLETTGDLESGGPLLVQQNYDLMICDIDLSDLVSFAQHKGTVKNYIFMTSQQISSNLEKLKKFPYIQNLISRDLEDRTFTVKNIVTTVTKILNNDLFGIEKYLAWGVDVQELAVTNSKQRNDLNQKMQEYFKNIGIRSSILDRCQVACEEMLMNAIYDAPIDTDGKPLYNHLPRTTEINLPPEHSSKLRFACDGLFLAISVQDPFGALRKDILIDYLESCYQGKAGSLNTNKGGAGRGLHQLVESSDLTIFNVKYGEMTEVISIYNLENAALKKETLPTLHYFFTE